MSDVAVVEAQQRGNAVSLIPTSLETLMVFSKAVAGSAFCPTQYRGKYEDIMIAIQMGAEVGLAPMAALQNIAVINGRPGVFGDAFLGIVRSHPAFVDIIEHVHDGVATCIVKRRGQTDTVKTFSVDDAKRARLWGKQGPWVQYPERMLQMRARGFACRDAFPDALRGIMPAEELQDYPPEAVSHGARDITPPVPLIDRIRWAETIAGLNELLPELQATPDADRPALRAAYAERYNALRGTQPQTMNTSSIDKLRARLAEGADEREEAGEVQVQSRDSDA